MSKSLGIKYQGKKIIIVWACWHWPYVDWESWHVCTLLQFLARWHIWLVLWPQIWDLADPGGKGCLDKHSFFISLKLVALAQNGKEVSLSNLCLPLPVPDMVRWAFVSILSVTFI